MVEPLALFLSAVARSKFRAQRIGQMKNPMDKSRHRMLARWIVNVEVQAPDAIGREVQSTRRDDLGGRQLDVSTVNAESRVVVSARDPVEPVAECGAAELKLLTELAMVENVIFQVSGDGSSVGIGKL